MTIDQNIVTEFQTKAQMAFEDLAREFNLDLCHEDELTFVLIAATFEIRLYVYPSHVPSANITIMPVGPEWNEWRQKSVWGRSGVWLAHLAAFYNAESQYLDTHFRTTQELGACLEKLVGVLREVGRDLLQGDPIILQKLIAYADERVKRSRSE